MYEQNRSSAVGRLVWAIVSLLVLVGLIWFVLWLLLWRSPAVEEAVDVTKETGTNAIESAKNATNGTSTDSQGSSTSGSSTGSMSTTSDSSSTSGSATSTATDTTTPQTSSTSTVVPGGELVATGPESIILPIVAVAAGGTVLYQIRLRRHAE